MKKKIYHQYTFSLVQINTGVDSLLFLLLTTVEGRCSSSSSFHFTSFVYIAAEGGLYNLFKGVDLHLCNVKGILWEYFIIACPIIFNAFIISLASQNRTTILRFKWSLAKPFFSPLMRAKDVSQNWKYFTFYFVFT